MTHAVVRGSATAAQQHLESLIRSLVQETGREQDRYCLNKLLFKCLRDHPHDIKHIEGTSGVSETNQQVLRRSIRTARALQAAGLEPGDTVMVISKNNLEFIGGVYFGSIFVGVVLYFLHHELTFAELKHFISLRRPSIIFMESQSTSLLRQTLTEIQWDIKVVQFGDDEGGYQKFSQFIKNFDGNHAKFRPADIDGDAPVITIPTSGSTGLPKAAVLTSKGFVAALASPWPYHDKFPTPTELYFCLSGASWVTHSAATNCSLVFGVSVLYMTENVDAGNVLKIYRKYKPSMVLSAGYLAEEILAAPGRLPGDLSNLKIWYLSGSAVAKKLIVDLKVEMSPDAIVGSAYGITEVGGFISVPGPGVPAGSIGKIDNTLQYKIVDEEGNTLEPNREGELLLNLNDRCFKEYAHNEPEYMKCFTEDGWFRTGDRVYRDEDENIFYMERTKFMIKYRNHHISPSEVERVICSAPGVQSAAVCETNLGPGALVVTLPAHQVTAHDVHAAVKSTLSDLKRLRGGLAFVPSLPLLNNGKLNRTGVKRVFTQLAPNEIHYDR